MTTSNPFADRIAQAAKEGYVNGNRRDWKPSIARYEAQQEAAAYEAEMDFPVPSTPMISDKQRKLIVSLLSERDLAVETRPKFRARLTALVLDLSDEVARLDRQAASNLITYLFGLPVASGTVSASKAFDAVPAGHYALDRDGEVTFYKVDRPIEGKWAGKVFVSLQHGSDYTSMSRQAGNTILGHIIDQGVQESMLRYGQELGHCGAPNCGLPLTNPESRQLGIGPVCRTKMGW